MSVTQKVKMNKLLLGGLWMFLSFPTANAMWCFNCDKPVPTLPCPVTEEMCWAGQGAACFMSNIYIGNTMISSKVGCTQNCENYKSDVSFMWNEFLCCFSDYCNK